MRAYLHRAFYDSMIGSNNTNSRNTVDSNRCLDANSFENNNSSNNRYNSGNRSQRYFRSIWSTTNHAQSNSNIGVSNFWNRTSRNRSTNSNNNNNNNGESTLARRVPVALSSHHYSMPYPAALPYPSETIYTEPVNATAILDGSYSLQFPGMFEMVDPCVEAYMASIQDNVEKEQTNSSRANNESTKGVCDENIDNITTLSLVSEGELTGNNSCNSNCVNDESHIDSVNNYVDSNNMREVSTLSNERANTDHINEETVADIASNINTDNNNNNNNNDINSSNQESNASLFSSFRQQTNIFDCDNEDTRSLEAENVSHAEHTMHSNNSNHNSNITTTNSNNNGNCNDDYSNNSSDQNILSVIINEPASIENRCIGKSKRHLLSRLFGSCKVKNNEGLKRNDRRRCMYSYDNSIRRQTSVSSSLTSLESFEEEAATTATDAEREAARNTETHQNTDNECQQEEENEQIDKEDDDNHHNNDNTNQEIDNASVNSVNANTITSSQNVANYDSTNNNYDINLHTCEPYKVNVLEGGYIIFTDDFVRVHPASLIATITHAYKLTSPTTHLTSKTKEQMSRLRSRHWQYHANGSYNTNISRPSINYNTTSRNTMNRDTTTHDVWDNEMDSALLNYDLVQRIHEIRKCVREAQLQHRPLFRLRSADAVYGSARYVQIIDNK